MNTFDYWINGIALFILVRTYVYKPLIRAYVKFLYKGLGIKIEKDEKI